MLWAAGALALFAGLTAVGIAVFAVVLVNAVFAFVQEHRSDRATEQLRNLLPRKVTVVRDSVPTLIDAVDLVVGDMVRLEAGDRVAADLEVTEAHGLLIDSSTLTGESVPESVSSGSPAWSGTFVVEGEGQASVTGIGNATRLAEIAAMSQVDHRPLSPLTKELHRLVRTIATIAVIMGAAFFVISVIIGGSASDGAIFGIGVTVALVPEGLLPTVTLSLAVGAQRMAREHALVRHLEAVETLGSTSFICTDKTGTLTRNQMEVIEAWTPSGTVRLRGDGYGPLADIRADDPLAREQLNRCAAVALACSTGRVVEVDGSWEPRGDPMEAAVDALARRLEVAALTAPTTSRFPFDPRRRRMSVLTERDVLVKGAPDAVLSRCSTLPDGAEESVHRLSSNGLRVLAVAERELRGDIPDSAEAAESGLTLVGLLGFEDPPRTDVSEALAACREAGINVAMVTGDHAATASAIADEVGLRYPGSPVVTGADLPADHRGARRAARPRRNRRRTLHAGGQAADRVGSAVARTRGGDDRRRGQRRTCPAPGRHRGGDGGLRHRRRPRSGRSGAAR